MNKQRGFTLIELVVVIVVLGILAVTAAPRFLNLQSDAKQSTLQGVKGSIVSAFTLFQSKILVPSADLSQCSDDVCLTINGVTIKQNSVDGNPFFTSTPAQAIAELSAIANIELVEFGQGKTSNFGLRTDPNNLGGFLLYPGNVSDENTQCYLVYTPASADNTMALDVVHSGC